MAGSELTRKLQVLVPSISTLTQGPIPPGSAACQASGFFYLTAVIGNSLWTLAIAVVTYAILVHPWSKLSILCNRRWLQVMLWTSIWATWSAMISNMARDSLISRIKPDKRCFRRSLLSRGECSGILLLFRLEWLLRSPCTIYP